MPTQPPIQAILLVAAILSLFSLRKSSPIRIAMLLGLLLAGFGFGYLAAASSRFDSIEPGRQTYLLYTTACVVAGLGWESLRAAVALRRPRLASLLFLIPSLVLGAWLGPAAWTSIAGRTNLTPGPGHTRRAVHEPILSSSLHPRLRWLLRTLENSFRPGDRIYYEEGGRSQPGGPADLFGGLRFGGILPYLTGLEVIGGPFLHVPVINNFTQIGMGRHFEDGSWTRPAFERYARLYRPSGIVCWSPSATSFCRSNPDLFEIVREDQLFVVARIKGFEGPAIRGRAEVRAEAGRLTVRLLAADVDGKVVLRYHTTPGLRDQKGRNVDAELHEGDPVPFIRLPYSKEPVTLELDPTPW